MSFRSEAVWGELGEHALLPFEQARMLPPAAYTSSRRAWPKSIAASSPTSGCASAAPPTFPNRGLPDRGDPSDDSTQPGAHRSVIAIRDDEGTITVFDNVCAHRGSPLLRVAATRPRITCPYHTWVYRLDGQLIGAPYMNRTVDGNGKAFDASRSPPHRPCGSKSGRDSCSSRRTPTPAYLVLALRR